MKTKQQTMSNPRIGRPNTAKRILSVLLTLVLLFSAVMLTAIPTSAEPETNKIISEYGKNSIVEFGYYPQSEVTNPRLIFPLSKLAGDTSTWTSYGYYTGENMLTGGDMVPSDYMVYTDVVYNGKKYRGVYFTMFRQEYTGQVASVSGKADSFQDDNDYYANKIYWFEFEPIQWRVINPSTGLVLSETILDSQAYNNYIIKRNRKDGIELVISKAWGSSEKTYHANNYEHSSIREWLNSDFYNTAFSAAQQEIIETKTLDNTGYCNNDITDSTNDKICLLPYMEVNLLPYFPNAASRQASGSDYAKAQGLKVNTANGYSDWRLRTGTENSWTVFGVDSTGNAVTDVQVDSTASGIRPALYFNKTAEIVQSYVTEIGTEKEKSLSEYEVGSIVKFGSYPQNEMTDDTLKTKLTSLAGATDSWTSYGYYSGTDTIDDGNMAPSDYMVYKDVEYNGNKYRGVYFTKYRPSCTGDTASATETDGAHFYGYISSQYYYGYNVNTIYWFKFEPIQWRILDPATGLVMSETMLDAQPYNNYLLQYGTDSSGDEAYWGNSAKTKYANNYENSSIRAWLNDDFYNTAFTASQRNIIKTTTLDNSAVDEKYSEFGANSTNDKIFLLSYDDVRNSNYGFSPDMTYDKARATLSSAYSKAQGNPNLWMLRSVNYGSNVIYDVELAGWIFGMVGDCNYVRGVRPAMCLKTETLLRKINVRQNTEFDITAYHAGDIIEFGSYPQSKVTNARTITALKNLAGSTSTWTSYGYYSGTGSWNDGNMAPSNYMFYKDVEFLGVKYRGVYFTKYRPSRIGDTASATGTESSRQDDNGYYVNTIYWFKFDPIQWRVLDPTTGLVVSETVLDSQAFNNYILKSGTIEDPIYWGNSEKTYYANNYEHSSIRAWLNGDFYNTAFSTAEKNSIATTTLDNSKPCDDSVYNPEYGCNNTNDKIFLLSSIDANNSYYFLTETDKQASGSAYAQSQGLCVYDSLLNWYLRYDAQFKEFSGTLFTDCVTMGGYVSNLSVNEIRNGVRPALCFNLSSEGGQSCTHTNTEVRNKVDATCGTEGYTGNTYCLDCGEMISAGTTIPATGKHTWDAGTVIKVSTCKDKGIRKYTCTTCSATKTKDIPTITTRHAGGTEVRNAKAATCVAGYTGDTYCLGCGTKLETGTTIPATENHAWNAGTVTKAATCKETGTRKYTCTNCTATKTENIAKNPSNHVGGTEIRNKKAATCGVAGYTGDTYCLGCGTKTATGMTTAATGSHVWDGGTVTREPRCNQEGEKTFTCTVCSGKTTETIAKSSHTPSSWIIEYDATCTSNGSRRIECQVCKETINRESIPARGHQDYDGNGYCDLCGTYTGGEVISNCSCDCHKTGFAGFIWKIKVFFWKLFGATDQQYCSCGEKHW